MRIRSTVARERACLGVRLRLSGTPEVFQEDDLNASTCSLYVFPMQRASPRTPQPIRSPAAAAAPLGPGSLTWRCFGDSRVVLLALRAGVLQAMHPVIAAALAEHSDVLENPLWRLVRSAGPILGVVYDSDPVATGRWVRDRHVPIRGRDTAVGRYRALDPGAFFWAHATFFEGQIATQELFGVPLSPRDRRRLYAESITWYGRYGVSMRPVPAHYEAFERYWERMLAGVLAATPIAHAAVRSDFEFGTPHPALDGPARALLRRPLGLTSAWLVRSTLPPRALEILGVSPTGVDRLALAGLQGLIRTAWPVLPSPLKRLPGASPGVDTPAHSA